MLGPRCLPFYFYPHPPRGGRLVGKDAQSSAFLFLSMPSARRATNIFRPNPVFHAISIHALREEGDLGRECR